MMLISFFVGIYSFFTSFFIAIFYAIMLIVLGGIVLLPAILGALFFFGILAFILRGVFGILKIYKII